MSMALRNINPQKEIFHHYDFPVYTTSKYRDLKYDTYRRITQNLLLKIGKFSEVSFLRNPHYHDKVRSLLKATLATETPTGNGMNPIGDVINTATYKLG